MSKKVKFYIGLVLATVLFLVVDNVIFAKIDSTLLMEATRDACSQLGNNVQAYNPHRVALGVCQLFWIISNGLILAVASFVGIKYAPSSEE